MPTFTASRISTNHNLLFPDRLEIDDDKVIYHKGYLIGYQSTTIQRQNISSVRINTYILFADIIIESSGGRKIVIEGLTKRDAREIYNLLQ